MALSNAGKKFVLENNMTTASLWAGLSANGTAEQGSAAGYARVQLPTNRRSVSNAGVLTLAASASPIPFYTANAANAANPSHIAVFSAASGGDQLTEWQALSPDPDAPANGQAVRIVSLTLAL